MSKLFRIEEDDLAKLEHTLPALMDAMMGQFTDSNQGANRLRVQWRTVQEILKNVRWEYGPPMHVQIIPAGGPNPDAHPM